MSVTMSQAVVPYIVRNLNAMSAILTKAEAYAESKKIDPSVLTSARLAPDMNPLTRQVQIATDMVKGCVARLSGQEAPVFADDETTFAQLRARVAKTLDYIQSVPAADIDAGETRTITLKIGGGEMKFSANDYVFGFALPNYYFHASTLYGILRHNGLEIGKRDFMGV